MKQFVKALDNNSKAFKYLEDKFSYISEAKLKAGIFVGPQIRQLLQNDKYKILLSDNERYAWKSFERVVSGFLGNYKDPNYPILVAQLISTFNNMGFHMSVKLHFLH